MLQGLLVGAFMAILALIYVSVRDRINQTKALNASLMNPDNAKLEDCFRYKANLYNKEAYKKEKRIEYSKFPKDKLEKNCIETRKNFEKKPSSIIEQLNLEAMESLL